MFSNFVMFNFLQISKGINTTPGTSVIQDSILKLALIQGTTKEGDKDYIVRVSFSANMNVDLHKQVFLEFVQSI